MWLNSAYYKEQIYPEKHENNTKYLLCRVITTIKYIDQNVKLYYSDNKNLLNIEDALIFKDEFLHDDKPLGTLIIDSDIIGIDLFYSMLRGEDTVLILAEYQGINYCVKNLITQTNSYCTEINKYYDIKNDFNKSLSTLKETEYAEKYVRINEKHMKLRTLKSMQDKFNTTFNNIMKTLENTNVDFDTNEITNNINNFIAKYENIDDKNIADLSKNTLIKVNFIDWRDSSIHGDKKAFDSNYKPLANRQALIKSINYMEENNIKPSIDYKLIILTNYNYTYYAAIISALKFKLPVMVTKNDVNYVIYPDKIPENILDFDDDCILEEKGLYDFMEKCEDTNILNKVGIIVKTLNSNKEIECKNICFGICTNFSYSLTKRLQILKIIGNKSNSENLNNHTRLFIVNSGIVPSNLRKLNRVEPVKIVYDFEKEKELFKKENCIHCDINTYNYKEFEK
jgi:hypothetical protein